MPEITRDSVSIESVLHEERIFPPPEGFGGSVGGASEPDGCPEPGAIGLAGDLDPASVPVKQFDFNDSSVVPPEPIFPPVSAYAPPPVPEPSVPQPTPAPKTGLQKYEVEDNHHVRQFVDQFQTGYRRAVVEKWLTRSGQYLPMILDVFRQKGLPDELVFTAMIESGFNPVAVSRAGAKGLWQFMAPTARRYGLRIDEWLDERLDPEKSTMAAARHLIDLYAVFGSWNLVQAAYNAGEMRVLQAIRAMGTSDFWTLRSGQVLPDETKNFIPAIQAATLIAREPERYGFVSTPAEPLSYEVVTVPKGTTVYQAARTAGIEIPIFCYHDRMPPLGACRMCLVQVEKMGKLQTSCTLVATDGMVVDTTSAAVKVGQEAILEFLLINHPLDCPICDKGGECPLQDQTFLYGPGRSRFIEPKRDFAKPVSLGPVLTLDRERCILCWRCVRFGEVIAGDDALKGFERGFTSEINTPHTLPRRHRRHRARSSRWVLPRRLLRCTEERGEHGLTVNRGADLESDAALVDDQSETEEPTALLLGSSETSDRRDIAVLAELQPDAVVERQPGGDASEGVPPAGKQCIPLIEPAGHLPGRERARDRHLVIARRGGFGGQRHRRRRDPGLRGAQAAAPVVARGIRRMGSQPGRRASEIRDQYRQLGDTGLSLGDLGVDDRLEPLLHRAAMTLLPRQRQLGDLLQRAAELLAGDEPQPFERGIAVHPVAVVTTLGRWQQPDLLVVTQRRRTEPTALRHLRYPVRRHRGEGKPSSPL